MNIELFKFCKNYLMQQYQAEYTKTKYIINNYNIDYGIPLEQIKFPTAIDIKNLYKVLDKVDDFYPEVLDILFDEYFIKHDRIIHELEKLEIKQRDNYFEKINNFRKQLEIKQQDNYLEKINNFRKQLEYLQFPSLEDIRDALKLFDI